MLAERPVDEAVTTPLVRRAPSGWICLAGIGVVVVGVSLIVPSNTVHAVLYLGLALVCVVAVIVGAVRNSLQLRAAVAAVRRGARRCSSSVTCSSTSTTSSRTIARPFPSLADGLYLSSYPFMIAGTVVLIRRRGRGGPATLIDASMIAVGLGVLFWVFVIQPVARQRAVSRCSTGSISTAYPVMDVLLLTVAARLAVMPSGRSPAYTLLGLGVVGLLIVDDAASGVIQLSHAFHAGTIVDAGWMALLPVLGGGRRSIRRPAPPTSRSSSNRPGATGPDCSS